MEKLLCCWWQGLWKQSFWKWIDRLVRMLLQTRGLSESVRWVLSPVPAVQSFPSLARGPARAPAKEAGGQRGAGRRVPPTTLERANFLTTIHSKLLPRHIGRWRGADSPGTV